MGRNSQGVRSIKLDKDDFVVDMCVINNDSEFITITENGFGKRSNINDYRIQSRGGKGIKAGNFNEKTGNLVALKQINEDEDLMLISDNGVIIRMAASDIRMVGRSSLGVKVMKLKSDAKIVSVATTIHVDNEPQKEKNLDLTDTELQYANEELNIDEENIE